MKVKHLELILYPESGFDIAGIESIISQYKSIKKYMIILHDQDCYDADQFDKEGNLIAKQGDIKKAHYHVYLNFGKVAIELSSAATWFGVSGNAVEKIKGHMIDVVRYYTHEKEPEKHQYSYADITANFDVEAFVAQEDAKCSVDELLERCTSGEITKLNHNLFIPPLVYVKHAERFERAFGYADERKRLDAHGVRSVSISWLAGKTGTGKSSYVRFIANELNVPFYFTSSGSDPFSKYANEPVVGFDDIRPGDPFPFSHLLRLLDPEFIAGAHARYKDVDLLCDYIFITCPYLPHEYARLDHTRIADDQTAQLFRRLDEVIYFEKEDIIHCYLDKNTMQYKFGKHAPNPSRGADKKHKNKPTPSLEIYSRAAVLDMENDVQEVPPDEIPF